MEGAMPGPAAKKNVRRRNARPDWRSLPPAGFAGSVPSWPFGDEEPGLWVELWRTPQAEAWSELGWTRVVARYVVLLMEQESGKANAALLAEIRQMEDRLGLSPMAMKRLQWEVADGAPSQQVADDNVVNLFG